MQVDLYCLINARAKAREFDRDRYLCALFAPPARRDGLYSLLAFNREISIIPESVSEPILGQMRIQWWRDNIDAIFRGEAPAHPVAQALSKTIAESTTRTGNDTVLIPKKMFRHYLDCRAIDLADSPVENMNALISYGAGTAGTLARMSARVLGFDDRIVDLAADQIGTGWALCGIIRSLAFQASRGKVYLPVTIMAQVGLTADEVINAGRQSGDTKSTKALAEAVAIVVTAARAKIIEGREHNRAIPRAAAVVMLPAILADGYLKRIEKCGFNPFDPRIAYPSMPGNLVRLTLGGLTGRY